MDADRIGNQGIPYFLVLVLVIVLGIPISITSMSTITSTSSYTQKKVGNARLEHATKQGQVILRSGKEFGIEKGKRDLVTRAPDDDVDRLAAVVGEFHFVAAQLLDDRLHRNLAMRQAAEDAVRNRG